MKKKYLFIGVSICLIILLSIGVSYSYWKYTYTADEVNNIDSTCFSLSLSDSNPINLTNAYPITDDEGKELTPYTFTITNSGDNKTCAYANYTVSLEMLNGTDLSSDYVAVWLNKGTSTSASVNLLSSYTKNDTVYYSEDKTYSDDSENIITTGKSTESRQLVTGGLAAGKSVTYTLGLWIDESVTLKDDSQDKKFTAKIIVTGQPVEEPKLNDTVLANNESKGEITSTILVQKVTNDTSGLYESEDDFGTSYVFRGTNTATNNYVQFGEYSEDVYAGWGDGFVTYSSEDECTNASSYNNGCTKIINAGDKMYWRIIRINGDGSIRLLYNGTKAGATTDSSSGLTPENVFIQSTAYNTYDNSNNNGNPIYVGYMYGEDVSSTDITSLSDEEKQALYDKANANTHDSTIKTVLDNWYSKYLLKFSSYLADSGFCNDRSIYADGNSNSYQSIIEGGGFLINKDTYYGAYGRNVSSPSSSLKCPQNNDFFTVNSVNTATGLTGNSALTNPIGLITADELQMAGQGWWNYGYSSDSWTCVNCSSSDGYYWSLSPEAEFYRITYLFFTYEGRLGAGSVNGDGASASNYARPVINLSSDTTISGGSGTGDDPYIVQTN